MFWTQTSGRQAQLEDAGKVVGPASGVRAQNPTLERESEHCEVTIWGQEFASKGLGQAVRHRQEQKATLQELAKICNASKKRRRRGRDQQRSR